MGDDELAAASDDRRWRERLRPRNVVLAVVGLLVLFVVWQVVAGVRAKPGPIRDARGEMRALLLRGQGVDVAGDRLSEAEALALSGEGWALLLDSVGVMRRVVDEAEAEMLADGVNQDVWDSTIGIHHSWPIDGSALYAPEGADDRLIELTRHGIARFIELGGDGLLDQMLASPVVVRTIPEKQPDELLIGVLFTELREARSMAKLAVGAMHESALRGDAEAAAAWCRRVLGLGGVYTRQATLIEHLVGQALVALVAERVRLLALSGGLDEPTAEALLEEFNVFASLTGGRRHGGMSSFTSALRGERLSVFEVIDHVHTASGRLILSDLNKLVDELGENPTLRARIERMPIVNTASFLYPSKSQTMAAAEEFYDSVIGPQESREGDAKYGGFQATAFVQSLPPTQVVLYTMLPAIDRIVSGWGRTRRNLEVSRLALAAAVYRHRTGDWPRDAMDLVGTVLDEPIREPVREWEDPAGGRVISLPEVLGP